MIRTRCSPDTEQKMSSAFLEKIVSWHLLARGKVVSPCREAISDLTIARARRVNAMMLVI